jgi:Skp family chaperone for outer membrane proteins
MTLEQIKAKKEQANADLIKIDYDIENLTKKISDTEKELVEKGIDIKNLESEKKRIDDLLSGIESEISALSAELDKL